MTDFSQTAQTYARAGWRVFPLAGKVPLTARGHVDASADPQQISAWAAQHPHANVGLAVPDGVAVIDIDPRNGGGEAWAALTRAHGPLPATMTVATGGGGAHLFLAVPPGLSLPKQLGPGVDVKQLGGYVVAAGSIHPETGQPYVLTDARPPAEAPAWIRAQARPRGESHAVHATTDEDRRLERLKWGMHESRAISDVERVAIDRAVDAVEPVSGQGSRYTTLVAMGGVLARKGWSRDSVEAFARSYIDRYGGDDPEHGVRGCLSGMAYPSGYYALTQAAGAWGTHLGAALDALPNPWGDELHRVRADAAADVARQMSAESEPWDELWSEHEADLQDWHDVDLPDDGPTPELAACDDPIAALGKEISFDDPEEPIEYVVAGYPWHRGAVNAIIGFANSGKTPYANALAVALASGTEFAGGKVTQGRVLVIAYESRAATHRYLKRIARGMGVTIPPGSLRIVGAECGALRDAKHVQAIIRAAGAVDYVIIDTYNAGMTGTEFNDPGFASSAKLLEVDAACVFVVLHTNKSEDGPPTLKGISGSGAMSGAVKAAVGLWRPDPDDKYLFEAVCVRDAGGVSHAPVRLRWSDTPDGLRYDLVERDAEADERRESQTEKIARYQKKIPHYFTGKPANEVADLADLVKHCQAEDSRPVERACTQLVKTGHLEVARSGRKNNTIERWRRGPNASEEAGAWGKPARASPPEAGPPRLPGM